MWTTARSPNRNRFANAALTAQKRYFSTLAFADCGRKSSEAEVAETKARVVGDIETRFAALQQRQEVDAAPYGGLEAYQRHLQSQVARHDAALRRSERPRRSGFFVGDSGDMDSDSLE